MYPGLSHWRLSKTQLTTSLTHVQEVRVGQHGFLLEVAHLHHTPGQLRSEGGVGGVEGGGAGTPTIAWQYLGEMMYETK